MNELVTCNEKLSRVLVRLDEGWDATLRKRRIESDRILYSMATKASLQAMDYSIIFKETSKFTMSFIDPEKLRSKDDGLER